jgi:hypothetical protein
VGGALFGNEWKAPADRVVLARLDGLPQAIGAQAAFPQPQVVSLSGDADRRPVEPRPAEVAGKNRLL